jgi:hypothetical protein
MRRLAISLERFGSLGALIAILAAFSTLAVSCGRRVPTAPVGEARMSQAVFLESYGSHGPDREVMVTLRRGVDPARLGLDYGARLVQSEAWGAATYIPGMGETPAILAARMSLDPRVLTSELNRYLETAESRQESFAFDDGLGSPETYAEQPATAAIGLDRAHHVSRGGGILVAILDTGADLHHPALAGRVAGGWDFVSGDADPTDTADGLDNDGDGRIDEAVGHGTHVAGIVALTAPDARLLIVRVLDADGRGDIMTVACGIQWAIAHGARVINMSLGMLGGSGAIQELLEQADRERGIVCVASAGNWGSNRPREFPARSSHALAVAAVDAGLRAASFTSFGNFVDMSGPGVAIRSAYLNGGYALWSGTSMAAAFVSGTAALLLAVHPDWRQSEVLARLAATARPIDTSANPDMVRGLGAGALDAGTALERDAGGIPENIPAP